MDQVGGEFPNTTWGMVLSIREPEALGRRSGLEALCHRYWGPIYHYARAAWAGTDDDAKDLTQEFFLWLIEGAVLARYAPERGSFRNYLKGLLRNFGRNSDQAARRLKRGGGRTVVSLDASDAPGDVEDPRATEAEEAFDRAWVSEVLGRAVERLRERSTTGEGSRRWRVFEAYDLRPPDERPTYAALAASLGIKESDVRNDLFAMREKLRAEVRAELSDTVASPGDLDEEWRRVVGD